jgi:hypothetical protein
VPHAPIALFAETDEVRELRRQVVERDAPLNMLAVERDTLSRVLRGRIEGLAGWALYNQGQTAEASVRLRRAVSVLPEGTVWWRTAEWRLGTALEASGSSRDALAAYVTSYRALPDPTRLVAIEALYKKLNNGSLNGLDRLLQAPATASAGPRPATLPADTTPSTIATTAPSTDATPEPATTITSTPAASEPTTTPTPAPVAEPTPAPTPAVEPTPAAPPATEASPSPSPSPEPAAASPTPTGSQTPEPVKSDDVSKPEVKRPGSTTEEYATNAPTAPTPTPEPTPSTPPAEATSPAAAKHASGGPAGGGACELTAAESAVSLKSNGGSATIAVTLENYSGRTPPRIEPSTPNWADITILAEPHKPEDGNASRFTIISVSPKTGAFLITFASPCGKQQVTANVQ